MKPIKRLLAITALILLLPLTLQAQTAVTQTTNSAAIGLTDNGVFLTSGTGVVVPGILFVDREALRIVSVTAPWSTTNPRVARGHQGTVAATHASGSIVYIGPSTSVVGPGPYWMADPPLGSCVAASEQYTVRINLTAGRVWKCVASSWSMLNNPVPQTFPTFAPVGAVIASAATIAPTSAVFHVSGAVAVVNITVPAGCAPTCTIAIVPDAVFTWTAAGNIYLAGTAVINKVLYFTYDGTKWSPSYIA